MPPCQVFDSSTVLSTILDANLSPISTRPQSRDPTRDGWLLRGGVKAAFRGLGRSTGGQLDGDPGGEEGILGQQCEVRIERATSGPLGHRLE